MTHQFNLVVHITAGTVAMVLGIVILFSAKGNHLHRRLGKYFVWLLAIVVSSAFVGWLFYRSNPFLLMLTMLAGYNTYAGYKVIKLREQRIPFSDLMIAVFTFLTACIYLLWLMQSDRQWSPSVLYSTVFSIALVTGYDMLKYIVLHEKLRHWWIYEHIYKMISSFSAVLSAFVGTVLPGFKPYSQIGPSALCVMLIGCFIIKEVGRRRRVVTSV